MCMSTTKMKIIKNKCNKNAEILVYSSITINATKYIQRTLHT